MSLDRSQPIEFGSFSDTAFLGSRQSPPSGAGGGNIAGDGLSSLPRTGKLSPQRFERTLSSSAEDNMAAQLGQPACDSGSNAGAGARHDTKVACQR